MLIFYDVDTQNDFMNEDGALYVPGAEEIKGYLKLLTAHAIDNNIQIVGSIDSHNDAKEFKDQNSELIINGGIFPDHCMIGTHGQQKIPETHTVYGEYFCKSSINAFNDDGYCLRKYLSDKLVTEAVVYGVATDFCVKAAVLGMQKMGIQCSVVLDAVRGVFPDKVLLAIQEMQQVGAKFISLEDALRRS